jgi:Protein of unknown function (DUF1553)/Protein of unknown function (DUF1549)
MNAARIRWAMLMGLALLPVVGASLPAAEPARTEPARVDAAPLPKPSEVQALTVYPTSVRLKGSDSAAQLIVTATVAGKLVDLTGDCQYEVADDKIATITASGRIVPHANGETQLKAVFGDKELKIAVQAIGLDENEPINFANTLVPIFSKLGCNAGGCHGKLSGQNGFRLSLLGADAELDYMTLVRENRGRRVSPSAPEHSLLLLKAAGGMAHGGGKRMDKDSDEYKVIRRWIASGTPFGAPTDPVVTKIAVVPEHRVLSRHSKQQLAIFAHYSDDHVEDVTRRVQYDSNDQEIAVVEPTGLVRSLNLSGEAAIMARYQGQVIVFRATVPLGVAIPQYAWEPKTVVDGYTQKKWQQLGIVPSELCNDEQFIRRVYLDICGTLPTPEQIHAFLVDKNANKRDALIDRLVDSSEYSYFFANKWADVLRVKRGNQGQGVARAFGTFAFHEWIRESIQTDKPYDQFARQILSAIGDETRCPPTVWYKDLQTADQFVDNAAQVFLGTRLQCAQCHHHPYEKWSQDDYWGLAAFFGRVARKTVPIIGGNNQQNPNQQRLVIFTRANGTVINKRTGKTAQIKPLDGAPVEVAADEDPRQKLIDWMVDGKNPFFARAVVNRYFAHFFGRGIVDPLDDIRVTNPPSNPELLDALARDLVEHKYSLKHLVRTLCKSRTYQLSSTPNDFNKHDKQAYARYYPRRMTAEVLFDAVCQLTNSPSTFAGLPQDTHAPKRALMLPDESFQSYFLDVFGRPQRISACECERVTEANLAQILHLLNSEEIQGKIGRAGGRADMLAKDPRSDTEKLEELFLWALGEKPNPQKLQAALEHIAKAKVKKNAYEDLLWALVNSKGFSFNK